MSQSRSPASAQNPCCRNESGATESRGMKSVKNEDPPARRTGSRADPGSVRLKLPDGSVVRLDKRTLRFQSIQPPTLLSLAVDQPAPVPITPEEGFSISAGRLARELRHPRYPFSAGFRRVSDHPRYSVRWSIEIFDVAGLAASYGYGRRIIGTMFAPTRREWHFLDGGVVEQIGYGWATRSWTAVQGAEVVRVLCLLLGIEQPRRIRGEGSRRALSLILEDFTNAALQARRVSDPPNSTGNDLVKYGQPMSEWSSQSRGNEEPPERTPNRTG